MSVLNLFVVGDLNDNAYIAWTLDEPLTDLIFYVIFNPIPSWHNEKAKNIFNCLLFIIKLILLGFYLSLFNRLFLIIS